MKKCLILCLMSVILTGCVLLVACSKDDTLTTSYWPLNNYENRTVTMDASGEIPLTLSSVQWPADLITDHPLQPVPRFYTLENGDAVYEYALNDRPEGFDDEIRYDENELSEDMLIAIKNGITYKWLTVEANSSYVRLKAEANPETHSRVIYLVYDQERWFPFIYNNYIEVVQRGKQE